MASEMTAGDLDPVEPDDPAALALARHIADHPVSTVQAAFRLLGFSLDFRVVEESAPDAS